VSVLLTFAGVSLKEISNSQTPLHIAAYEGHLEVINVFLGITDESIGKPDLDAQDKAGWTGNVRGSITY
jgi:hypothetical protein